MRRVRRVQQVRRVRRVQRVQRVRREQRLRRVRRVRRASSVRGCYIPRMKTRIALVCAVVLLAGLVADARQGGLVPAPDRRAGEGARTGIEVEPAGQSIPVGQARDIVMPEARPAEPARVGVMAREDDKELVPAE